MPFIINSLTNSTSRADIIWDIYPDHNLKAEAQAKRGNPGVTIIVEGSTPIPRDWNKFLANSRNKVQLFRFLSKDVIEASSQFTDVVICSTYDDHVLVSTSDSQSVADFDTIMLCNHQEADSEIFLHLSHAAQQGHSKAFIRTVDSDVVIIAVGHFGSLGVMELWIGFGTGKAFQHIPVHEIIQTLGSEKSLSCPLFHSFPGCDTIVPWYREEDNMGSMAGIPWPYGNSTHSFRWSYALDTRLHPQGTPWTLDCCRVQQEQWLLKGEWCETSTLHPWY